MRVTACHTTTWTLLLGCLASGCGGGVRPVVVTPESLAALETARAARPEDPDLATRAGIGWYNAGRYELARDILAAALALDPARVSAAIHLGLSHQALGDLSAARLVFLQARTMRLSRSERSEVEARLVVLSRLVLAEEARQAVAREQRADLPAPSDRVVAVLPFQYHGDDDELRALGRGVTHLVVSDLARIDRLTLLERERVQAVADELALVAGGRADPDFAARSGRLLGAARVVQGAVWERGAGGPIQVAANVIRTSDGAVAASGQAEDRLSRLLDLQKRLVFDLLDQLGVVPTPAERRLIEERPTADLQAFLAFSRGLEASDRGDFAEARRLFDAASARDAGFGEARMRGAELHRIIATARVGRPARAGTLGQAVSVVAPSTAGQLEARTGDPLRRPARAQVQEGLNRDDPTLIGLIGTIIIVVPRP